MRLAAAVLLGALLAPTRLAAQEVGLPSPPPPSGITPTERDYALGFGIGSLSWDDGVPYDDVTLMSVGVERRLWQGLRGRARLGFGETDLRGIETSVSVILLDLELLFSPAFGPLQGWPVLPYAVGGLGALVTDPSSLEGAEELRTESQSQWTVGGGVRARPFRRWELEVEGTSSGVRLLDPLDPENRESETIHNLRWEGRVSWIF